MSGQSVSSLQSGEVLALKPCVHCNRTFSPKVLLKHEAICERGIKHRQTFNSAQQRLEAVLSLQEASPPATQRSSNAERPATSTKMPNTATLASKSPPPKRNPTPSTAAAAVASTSRSAAAARSAPNSPKRSARDAPTGGRNILERCPHCERSFGLRAIEKHVAYCMAKSVAASYATQLYSEETLNAKKRMEARMKYRPPKPKVPNPKY